VTERETGRDEEERGRGWHRPDGVLSYPTCQRERKGEGGDGDGADGVLTLETDEKRSSSPVLVMPVASRLGKRNRGVDGVLDAMPRQWGRLRR
jgi:hypothetical protein